MAVKELLTFSWDVVQTGYYWLDTRPTAGGEVTRYLTYGPLSRKPSEAPKKRSYEPLKPEHQGLFRVFAKLEPSEEGIVTFANRYGFLGGGITCGIEVPLPDGSKAIGQGEPLRAWQQEIMAMRDVLELWDLAQSGDEDRLAALFEIWGDGPFVHLDYCKEGSPLGQLGFITASETPELVRYALLLAIWHLNERLRERTSAAVSLNAVEEPPTLRLAPKGLIGALWLQAALVISGSRRLKVCPVCGKLFAVAKGRNTRRDRVYCSHRCKIRAYRQRKKEEGRA